MPTANTITHLLTTITLTVALSLAPAVTLRAESAATAGPSPPIATVASTYGRLPLSFEVNKGQADSRVQFLMRGREHQLFLTPNEAVLALRTGEANAAGIRMKFEGADPKAEVVGLEQLPGIVNYLIGKDPSKWRTEIPTYEKVQYRHVYPGIDLVYYGHQGQLEYDLIVAPGVDPKQIALSFEGAEQVAVDEHGDLVISMSPSSTTASDAPTVRLHKPVLYQRLDGGQKQLVNGAYQVLNSDAALSSRTQRVVFQVASYDTSKPLVIDPVLSWATYLGGSGGDSGLGIAVDQAGNAYVTGETRSDDFPGASASLIQSIFGGDVDAFVTKINAAGTSIVYSTYIGGTGEDVGNEIAVDKAGNAYVAGRTSTPGSGFPGTAGSPIQSTNGGGQYDAFVAKVNAAGTAIVYSTYLGGSGTDFGEGIAVDAVGNAYVVGFTDTPGSGFPGTVGSPIQSTQGGLIDAFVTKLNAAGTAIVYSSYLGGSNDDFGSAIAIDKEGGAYIVGTTFGSDFPGTADSLIQNTHHGGTRDAFVTKINANGTAIVYSTYLGTSGEDQGSAVAADGAGNAYVNGTIFGTGSGFPGTASSLIQSAYGGNGDAFVTKLNAAGTAIVYSTYLGGSGSEAARGGIAVDAWGNAYVTGDTTTPSTPGPGFPGTAGSAIQRVFGGYIDAFVTKINAAGTAIIYSTYLGGSDADQGTGIALDEVGDAYVTGAYSVPGQTDTPGTPFPGTTNNLIQSTYGGNGDAFVAKISTTVPFARFTPIVKIDLRHAPRKDWFAMLAPFRLGADSNGIFPLSEPVTIRIGTFSKTIPAGAFILKHGKFRFAGRIDGVKLFASLRLIKGNSYELWAFANCATLTGTRNPVRVALAIGDDSGNATITAHFGPKPKLGKTRKDQLRHSH